MKRTEHMVLLLIAAIVTTLAVYVAVRLTTTDAAFSVVPGWHTTIYPAEITWSILTAFILAAGLIVYVIFKLTLRLLTLIRKKRKA
jgi:di/tricarboxylate transporter